jgi:hypothetical protein
MDTSKAEDDPRTRGPTYIRILIDDEVRVL